ncbi:hypothetical protein RFI_33773, partial [Reticulomyxa filosa]
KGNLGPHSSDEKNKEDSINLADFEQIISDVQVPCCSQCFVQYHRSVCPECGYEYCNQCREKYHQVLVNSSDVCREFQLEADPNRKKLDQEQMRLTRDYISKQDWSRCPGCKAIVQKTEGCNHMTHGNCAHPSESESNETHFCYCCGDVLTGSSHNMESDGTTLHFPDGVFKNCRKADGTAKKHENILTEQFDTETDKITTEPSPRGRKSGNCCQM